MTIVISAADGRHVGAAVEPVTAETLTDDQIHDLRRCAEHQINQRWPNPEASHLMSITAGALRRNLDQSDGDGTWGKWRAACADAINVRRITAASLLESARRHGVTALAVEPQPGWPCKVLLASLGIDVQDSAVQARLLELLRTGEIVLTRVDIEVPADRLYWYQASRFWGNAWFDCISIDGALVQGSEIRWRS